jgi:hypothetical protein
MNGHIASEIVVSERTSRPRRRLVGALATVGVTSLIVSSLAMDRPARVNAAYATQPTAATPTMGAMPGMAMGTSTPGPTGSTPTVPMTMYDGAYRMEMLPLTGNAPTAAERAYAVRLAAVAARFAARFSTTAAARAAGYRTYGVLDVPGQGDHYFDPIASIEAEMGGFDANRPPFLVYNGARLAGIMYYVPANTSLARLNRLMPRSLVPWHKHVDTCVVGGARAGHVIAAYTSAACTARGGRFYPSTGWMAHVWLGQPVGPTLFSMDLPGPSTR